MSGDFFFAFRTGKNSHRITLSEPIAVAPKSRRDRAEAIARITQQYVDLLMK